MEIQWALVLFTVVAGAGAWLFAWAMLASLLKRAPEPSVLECTVSFALLVIGGLMSVAHLKHVDRILEALNHPTSGIFVEAALIGIMCALVAIYLVLLVRDTSAGARRAVGITGALVGVVFSYACGASYMMEARQAWMTVALPLGYCATAAAAGAGAHLLVKALEKRDDGALSTAGLFAAAAGIVAFVLAALFCVQAGPFLAAAGTQASAGATALFVALAVTAAAGFAAKSRPRAGVALGSTALAGGFAGAVALRVVMWLVGTPLMNFFLMPLD